MACSIFYPRILFSALCGIACVLLVVLCLRSYWWADLVQFPGAAEVVGWSERGGVEFNTLGERTAGGWRHSPDGDTGWERGWEWSSVPIVEENIGGYRPAWRWSTGGASISIGFPFWSAILVSAVACVVPWICWSKRLLRIAWSVSCGLVAVLFYLLWVRSSSILDFGQMHIAGGTTIHVQSVDGQVMFFRLHMNRGSQFGSVSLPSPLDITQPLTGDALPGGGGGYDSWQSSSTGRLSLPYWLITILPFAFASFPWFPIRFSVRTMLISTTLVAVGLGLIVWAMRG